MKQFLICEVLQIIHDLQTSIVGAEGRKFLTFCFAHSPVLISAKNPRRFIIYKAF